MILGDSVYTVTAVGELANRNLKNIGHVCLKFDARTSPELPGDIHLEGRKTTADSRRGYHCHKKC
jgi:PTS system glucitol/sorbitol-specific IIA component